MKNVFKLNIGLLWLSCLFIHQWAAAQAAPGSDTLSGADSVELVVRPFGTAQRNLSTAVVRTYYNQTLKAFSQASLLPAINTVAGVRMEERSPGSYRLNIRGSALRSPFGVRNVKMYWNGIPFTDAGGNTYFNQLAINSAEQFDIVRGPAGSMYGAGTGGLVLMQSLTSSQRPDAEVLYQAASYHSHQLQAHARFGQPQQLHRLSYAFTQSDGYRQQSAMRRHQAAYTQRLQASSRHQLLVSALFTHLYYQTPGGLTPAEYAANPRASRPAVGNLPSAQQAQAAIDQYNALLGLTNTWKLNSHWQNTTALYGSYAHISNPAVRNYEQRSEPQAGGRTTFAWQRTGPQQQQWNWQSGAEFQAGWFNTQVSRNNNGSKDTLVTNDDSRLRTGFVFTQLEWSIRRQWYVLAGLSINANHIAITRLKGLPAGTQSRTYRNEWAPRLQLTRQWPNQWRTQLTYSRGFSPPTLAEVLPSTGRISTGLEAELADNLELSQSALFWQNRLRLDITAFYLNLRQTLVQQRDAAGADFFVNAGRTQQQGIESSLQYLHFLPPHYWLQTIDASIAYTYSHFTYTDYTRLGVSYTGNRLPGVPRSTWSLLTTLQGKQPWSLRASWYYNSRVMLNDANSFSAEPFHLLGLRMAYALPAGKTYRIELFAGADNLLNQTYSLGNDINAAANRFYNAAPARNYYAGLAWRRKS